MAFDFFDIKDEEPKKKPPKPKKEKEECPYCGKLFSSVARHMKTCPDNPKNIEKPKPKPAPTVIQQVDETKLIEELREQFKKSMTSEQKEAISLSPEDAEKIEKVSQFLGGTEGYQFIYKTITGDKIRGSMPYIIEQCIEWLRKHQTYILHYKTKWTRSK